MDSLSAEGRKAEQQQLPVVLRQQVVAVEELSLRKIDWEVGEPFLPMVWFEEGVNSEAHQSTEVGRP